MGLKKAVLVDTLDNLLVANGHRASRIFYLKVDIEGTELRALPGWVESGVLAKVDQLAMELHLNTIHEERRWEQPNGRTNHWTPQVPVATLGAPGAVPAGLQGGVP